MGDTNVNALQMSFNFPNTFYILFYPPSASASGLQLSESRWDVEELLLRYPFIPQCSVHPLLWRLWHQAVCRRRTPLFWPARQLRRTVELAFSVSSIAQTPHPNPGFLLTSPSVPLPLSVSTRHCLWYPSFSLICHSVLLTRGLRSMIFPTTVSQLSKIVVVYVCVHHHSPHSLWVFLCSFHYNYSVFVIWKCTNYLLIFNKSCNVCH